MSSSHIRITISHIATDVVSITALKKNPTTHHRPIIVLVAQQFTQHIPDLITAGIDDYILLPATDAEIEMRTTLAIARAHRDQNMHPLTKLPGSTFMHHVIQERLSTPLAVIYIDIDNFKAYNDFYGFAAGDSVLLHTTTLITDIVQQLGLATDIVCHIGGDDFVIITTPQTMHVLTQTLCSRFDATVEQLYAEPERINKQITVRDRRGIIHTFPLMTLSCAIVHNEYRTLHSYAQSAHLAAELKKYAKRKPNGERVSNYVVDRRKT